MKTHKLLSLSALLLLQTNLFAIQSDTLNLDEVMLKSALINHANPALTVSEISLEAVCPTDVAHQLKSNDIVWF